jgi:hypothetical protein
MDSLSAKGHPPPHWEKIKCGGEWGGDISQVDPVTFLHMRRTPAVRDDPHREELQNRGGGGGG